MRIKKQYLKLFVEVIGSTNPRFTEARFRDRFSKRLMEEYSQYDKDRMAIAEDLADKDKEGKSIVLDGHYQFSEENKKKFAEEFMILREEECTLLLEGDEPVRLLKLIESTNYAPKLGETEIIDDEIIAAITGNKKPKIKEEVKAEPAK